MTDGTRLWGGDGPLAERHRVVLLDLDGVVYLVGEPITGAPEAIQRLRDAGIAPRFVTNNASRRPGDVAELLTAKGIPSSPAEVFTSAQAAAAILRDNCEPGATVLIVGSDALAAEVHQAGLRPVRDPDGEPVTAVVQGYGPQVGWKELADATILVRSGALWVATNTDKTLPSPRGPLPGNGTMVAAVATAVGREPDMIAGKPEAAMLRHAVAEDPASAPIVVGDRWDTDIAAAVAAGMPGLLVLSGVVGPRDILEIPPYGRPRYLAWTMAGLWDVHPTVSYHPESQTTMCREWTVLDDAECLTLGGAGDSLDALRALSQAAWVRRDAEGGAVKPIRLRGNDDKAAEVLEILGLTS